MVLCSKISGISQGRFSFQADTSNSINGRKTELLKSFSTSSSHQNRMCETLDIIFFWKSEIINKYETIKQLNFEGFKRRREYTSFRVEDRNQKQLIIWSSPVSAFAYELDIMKASNSLDCDKHKCVHSYIPLKIMLDT